MEKFKFLEHTADIKFQAFGKTLEKAFENSALALQKSIIQEKIKTKKTKKISISNTNDKESLLRNFLDELIYLFEAENFIFSKITKLKIKENELNAELIGDKSQNYNFLNHVKAITYNQMFVKKIKGLWVCQVVLDV